MFSVCFVHCFREALRILIGDYCSSSGFLSDVRFLKPVRKSGIDDMGIRLLVFVLALSSVASQFLNSRRKFRKDRERLNIVIIMTDDQDKQLGVFDHSTV